MADEDGTWPCNPTDLLDCTGAAIDESLTSIVNDAITDLANKVVEAAGDAIASLGTFWVEVDPPNVATTDESGVSTPAPTIAFIQDSLSWYMAAAAVVAVLIGAGRMAWERRAQPGRDLLKAMFTLVVVAGASLTGITLAVSAADGFARWIITNSTEDFGAQLVGVLNIDDADIGVLSVIVVILVAVIAMLASLLQIVLLVIRGGFLVLLAGVLPLSAAFTNTEMGRSWFGKAIGWLIAFILYKPAAAIVYATAFQLVANVDDGGDRLINAATGLTLMIMALVALPALLRFTAPMVGAVAGSGGGAGIAAAAAMALPTGAAAIRSAGRGAAAAGAGSGAAGAGGGATGSNGSAGGGARGAGRGSGGSPSGGPGGSAGGAGASGGGARQPAMAGAGGSARSGAGGGGTGAAGGASAAIDAASMVVRGAAATARTAGTAADNAGGNSNGSNSSGGAGRSEGEDGPRGARR